MDMRDLAKRYGLQFEGQPSVMDLGIDLSGAGGPASGYCGGKFDGRLELKRFIWWHCGMTGIIFLRYDAAPIVRERYAGEISNRCARRWAELKGKISEEEMRKMNYEVGCGPAGMCGWWCVGFREAKGL